MESVLVSEQLDLPNSIELLVRHRSSAVPLVMARAYVSALRDAGRGNVVEVLMPSSKRLFGEAALYTELEGVGPDIHFWSFCVEDGTTLICHRERTDADRWHVEIGREDPPTEDWIQAMTNVSRDAIAMPDFLSVVLERDGGRVMTFVPRPPLAGSFHLVTTTERQVTEHYEDPAAFWRVWETIERIGDVRLCMRHLDALEEGDWLARTFEDTMQLARHAKPKLTHYDNDPCWHPDYAPWWEHGDYQDEKAGYPALQLVGYDTVNRVVEFSGYILRWSRQDPNEGPWHVLVTEIQNIRALVAGKRTEDGLPVEMVSVVFAEEWMARQERRPLLDAGARVYYMDRQTGELVAVSD